MTKKDYVLIAEAILDQRPEESWLNKAVQYKLMTRSIAQSLAQDNSRFNYNTFYKACGLESDGMELKYI